MTGKSGKSLAGRDGVAILERYSQRTTYPPGSPGRLRARPQDTKAGLPIARLCDQAGSPRSWNCGRNRRSLAIERPVPARRQMFPSHSFASGEAGYAVEDGFALRYGTTSPYQQAVTYTRFGPPAFCMYRRIDSAILILASDALLSTKACIQEPPPTVPILTEFVIFLAIACWPLSPAGMALLWGAAMALARWGRLPACDPGFVRSSSGRLPEALSPSWRRAPP